MPLPDPSSYIGNGPDYGSYFQAGSNAVLQPIAVYNDAQAQVVQQAQRQAQLDVIRQRAQLDALLAPGQVKLQQNEITAGQQGNQIQAAGIPFAASNAANANAIGTANATYALPNAAQEYYSRQLGNATAAQGIGPITINGQVARQALPLPGPAAFPDTSALPVNSSQGNAGMLTATATGYHPVDSSDPAYKMEGGHLDAQGNPIATLDDYRAGKSPFVTAAIDRNSPLFGQTVFSPTLNAPIKLSDTGSAFTGKGNSRIDIARDTAAGANSDENNGPIQLTLGNTSPNQGVAVPPIAPVAPPASGDAEMPDLSNLAPIGVPSTPIVHPAVSNALSVANQTAAILPAASMALANKALDAHAGLTTPAISQPIGSIPYLIPKQVPGYIGDDGTPVPSTIRPNSFITQNQINPDVERMMNSGHTSGVDPKAFINGNMFDPTGYESAVGKSTTELRQSGQQFEQSLLKAAPAVAAIESYAQMPDEQRNASADNQAINNAVIAETGALPTEAARKAFLEHSGLGDTVSRLSAQFTKPNDPPFLSRTQLQDIVASGKNSLLQRAQTLKMAQDGGAQAVADNILAKSGGGTLKAPDATTLANAQAAIAKGAPRAAVIARLQSGGYDASGL